MMYFPSISRAPAFGALGLSLLLLSSSFATAQSNSDYWLPGGIGILEANWISEFPDDLNSRKWIIGISSTLANRCGVEPSALDVLLALNVQSYIFSAAPKAAEGEQDALTLIKERGCKGAEQIYHASWRVMGYYGGQEMEPEDGKRWLRLASPKTLKELGLTPADAQKIIHAPPWWLPLIGKWTGVSQGINGKETVELSLQYDRRIRFATLTATTKEGGTLIPQGAWVHIIVGDQTVLFRKCSSTEQASKPMFCKSHDNQVSFDGRLSPDQKTIEGKLTVWFWRKPVFVTLTKEEPRR